MKKVLQPIGTSDSAIKAVFYFHPSRNRFWLILIPLLVFIVYKSVLDFKLVEWDDKIYIQETPVIRGLNFENVKQIFSEKVLRSYNPLVLLTFAADYEISNLKPEWCHGVNLFFHILNSLLVFACLKELRFKKETAGVIALLFGLHPLSVEAVAWIAGRKDMIYGFFYLLAWLSYLQFVNTGKKHKYILCFLFFVFSLFSKVQAITFPFVLILSDFMLSAKWSGRSLLNKIPFFVLSFVFGLIAISGGELVADKYAVIPDLSERINYSIMAFGLYFQKLLFPFSLTTIYQFPLKGSFVYYRLLFLGMVTLLFLTVVIFKTIRKNRVLAGGLLYFVISISVVLHIVAFNSALIYERFSYLAGIGIFISVLSLDKIFPFVGRNAVKIIIPVIFIFCFMTLNQAKVWRNGETLWSNVIEMNPQAAEAFINRGRFYAERGNYENALKDFNESIKLNPKLPYAYSNISTVYFDMKNMEKALEYNSMVLRIDSTYPKGIYDRGNYFFNLQQYDSAVYYFKIAEKYYPDNASLLFYTGMSYYGKYNFESAIENFKKTIVINSEFSDAYTFLANSYAYLKEYDRALDVIKDAENKFSGSSARNMVSEIYILTGFEYFKGGDTDSALYFYEKANKIMPENANALYYIGEVYLSKQNLSAARDTWKKVLELNPGHELARSGLMNIGVE